MKFIKIYQDDEQYYLKNFLKTLARFEKIKVSC